MRERSRRALTHVEPTLTTPAAEAAVAEAQTLVDEPVTLTFKGEDVGSLTPERLAKLVRFRVGVESFRVGFDPRRVAKAVEPMLEQWRQKAVNARFIVDGRRVRIRPSRPGLAVDGRWVADSVATAVSGSISRASLRLKQIRADLTTAEAEKLGIRRADLHVHHGHGAVLVEPDPQRAADGELHRRDDRSPRRGVLVQRVGRPADLRARLPRGPDDHRLAAAPGDRRRRLPDGDDALQQRLRARPADRRAPQPQLLHLALSDRARRDRLLGRARLRVQERPEDGDPDQDELHRLDADLQLLRHRSRAGVSSRRPGSARTGARRA